MTKSKLSNHALSYQMSKEDDYFKPLTESETEIHNELGDW